MRDAFNGIVQHIPENGAYVLYVHKGKEFSICHASETYVILQAIGAFGCEDYIKYTITRIGQCFLGMNGFLHFKKILFLFFRILLSTNGNQIVLQVVEFPTQQFYVIDGQTVLVVLVLQNRVHCLVFTAHAQFLPLILQSIEHHKTTKVYQSAHIENRACGTGKGCSGHSKTDIADGKGTQGNHERSCQLLAVDVQSFIAGKLLFFQTIIYFPNHSVEQQHGTEGKREIFFVEMVYIPDVELPVQRSSKFCQNKSTQAAEHVVLPVSYCKQRQKKLHQSNGSQHRRNPEKERQDISKLLVENKARKCCCNGTNT